VSFGGRDDTFSTAGLDVTLDTRQNPAMPRNAVLASAGADVLFFGSGPTITRTRLEATGFVGVVGQHVLVVHALREDANGPLPPYLRSILGGWWTLRGYETGFMTGDTLLSGSLEYRVPIGSPRRFGKLGVSAFMDWGTAYDHGQSLSSQPIYRGAGGTVWFAVMSARLAMAVGRGLDGAGGTRVHFSGTIGF
jgi:outer membrane protein insertion porin family